MPLPPYQPGPFDWDNLSQDDSAELWGELIDWVAWLRREYELSTTIRPCWFHHSPARRELAAAMDAWRAAYEHQPQMAHSFGPATWHWQVLWPMVARFETITDWEGCTAERCGHRPAEPATLADLPEVIAAEVERHHHGSPDEPADADDGEPMTMPAMLALIDEGRAEPDDPGDEFSDVTLDGRRWVFDDDTGNYHPQ